jgi:hypothetical protein
MRIELSTEHDMSAVDFSRGTTCAVCGLPIDKPAAVWIAVKSVDFYLHKDCEPKFTPDTAKRHLGDMVLAIQDETLHDAPPERN